MSDLDHWNICIVIIVATVDLCLKPKYILAYHLNVVCEISDKPLKSASSFSYFVAWTG